MSCISKAIIPAAGLGTRMLPITKVIPKEMLPVGLKPMTQYAVEEAREAPNFGNCGRIDYRVVGDKLVEIERVYDKAPGTFFLGSEPSALRCFPRAIHGPDYFYYIEQCRPFCLGEFDDVPVMQRLVKEKGLLGYILAGKGFDVGNYGGYMAANNYLMQEARLWK